MKEIRGLTRWWDECQNDGSAGGGCGGGGAHPGGSGAAEGTTCLGHIGILA